MLGLKSLAPSCNRLYSWRVRQHNIQQIKHALGEPMKHFLIATAALFVFGCGENEDATSPPEPAEATAKTLAQGELIGFIADNGAHVWRGVPYGADTSGENRWRAPRPAPAWEEARIATEFAPVCPQIATPFTPIEGFVNGRLEGSEDCLALDIYAPANAEGRDLPVMVWIHGGSNVSGASRLYVGDRLADNEDVIVVSVQYRLGPLGWFSHKVLREEAETPEDTSANFGTLDLIASLKWVRNNITEFGGDPERVTIFGESAGGHNVATLLGSPLAKGLFHNAIVQSGSFDSTSVSDAEGETGSLLNTSHEVAERLGGSERFHTASMQEIFDAYELADGYMEMPRIIEDGVVLPATPLRQAFASTETFNAVPIITGTNRDEMKLFYIFDTRLTKKILGFFYVARDQDLYDAAAEYSGRVWRMRSVDQPAALMAIAGHSNVYAYRFDWDEGGRLLWMDFSKLLGAAHALEIPFVFNRFELLGDADSILFKKKTLKTREELSRAMGAYWGSFARDGVPVNEGASAWPAYSADQAVIHFDSANDKGVRIRQGEETVDALISDLKSDERLDQNQRCQIAAVLGGVGAEDHARLMKEVGC